MHSSKERKATVTSEKRKETLSATKLWQFLQHKYDKSKRKKCIIRFLKYTIKIGKFLERRDAIQKSAVWFITLEEWRHDDPSFNRKGGDLRIRARGKSSRIFATDCGAIVGQDSGGIRQVWKMTILVDCKREHPSFSLSPTFSQLFHTVIYLYIYIYTSISDYSQTKYFSSVWINS